MGQVYQSAANCVDFTQRGSQDGRFAAPGRDIREAAIPAVEAVVGERDVGHRLGDGLTRGIRGMVGAIADLATAPWLSLTFDTGGKVFRR